MTFLEKQSEEVRFAVELVRQCSIMAREIQQGMVTSALEKDDRSPVTVADFAVQAVVGKRLAERFPGVPLVAEESTRAIADDHSGRIFEDIAGFVRRLEPSADRRNVKNWIDRGQADFSDCFWVLDPIDGTKGFLRKDQYAIALALIQQGEIQLGILGCPRLNASHLSSTGRVDWSPADTGTVVVASRGQGTWVAGEQGAQFSKVEVSKREDPGEAVILRSVESGHTNVDRFSEIAGLLATRETPVLMDSQAKYALLAAGQGDLLLRLLSPKAPDYREKIWDHAAGVIAVREAGGTVTDLAGSELDFKAGRRLERNRGVVASNGALHAAALRAVAATS